MKNNNLSDQLIDDFVMGLLNDNENQKINDLMEVDSDLASQVEMRKEMIFGLEAYGRRSLKEELKNIHNEVIGETKNPAKRRSIFPYIAVAASILVLVLALGWLLGNSEEINTKDLYTANFEQYELSLSQRDKSEEDIIKMEQLYLEEKYAEALPFFETELVRTKIKSSQLLLATGIAHLELNNTQKALSYFKQITAKGDFDFENEASWYSALAYLKSNDLESTKKELEPLVKNTEADHHQAAKKLLKAITK